MAKRGLALAAAALERALARVGAQHMIIGGLAVIAHGVRRLTDDIDVALWAEGVDLVSLLRHLARERIVPRVDDAVEFAKQSQVLLLRHGPSGVDVDLSLAWLPFERAALERATGMSIGRARVRVATPDDLIVYKAIAARERDLSDVERLLEIHGSSIQLARVRHTVADLASALERPDLIEGLESIVRKAARARKIRAFASHPRGSKRRKKR